MARKEVKGLIDDDFAEIKKLHEIDECLIKGNDFLERMEDVAKLAAGAKSDEEKSEISKKVQDIKSGLNQIIQVMSKNAGELGRDEVREQKMTNHLSTCIGNFQANSKLIENLISIIKK